MRVTTTERELIAAFTEWDRLYREEPEKYMSVVEHLLGNTPDTYGELAAAYLFTLLPGAVFDA